MQITYQVRTNAINIEISPDLICAERLDTSRQCVVVAFGKPLVLRIHLRLAMGMPYWAKKYPPRSLRLESASIKQEIESSVFKYFPPLNASF